MRRIALELGGFIPIDWPGWHHGTVLALLSALFAVWKRAEVSVSLGSRRLEVGARVFGFRVAVSVDLPLERPEPAALPVVDEQPRRLAP